MQLDRQPDGSTVYVDSFSREWSPAKLDTILADNDVALTVLSGANVGLRPDGTWDPYAVSQWAKVRYVRWEVAALIVVLVARFFDTIGSHYLTGEARA